MTWEDLLPLAYVIVGTLAGYFPVYFHNKKEFENQRKMLLFEKSKLNKIEVYSKIVYLLYNIPFQVRISRNVLKGFQEINNCIKVNKQLSNDEVIEIIELMPLDEKPKLYDDLNKKGVNLVHLGHEVLSIHQIQKVSVEKTFSEVLQQIAQFSLFVETPIINIIENIEKLILYENFFDSSDEEFEKLLDRIKEWVNKLKVEMKKDIEIIK